jgi:hypothetical protein
MANVYKNASFEQGWYHTGGVAELQTANEWLFSFKPDGTENPISVWPFYRPETRVLPKSQVPEHEHDDFFWHGDFCLKWFGFHKSWQASQMQRVMLAPGVHRLSIGVYPDVYNKGNPKEPAGDELTAMIRFLWLTETEQHHSVWKTMQPYLVKQRFSWDLVTLGDSGLAGWEIRMGHPVKNTGVFLDSADLQLVRPLGDVVECDHTDTARVDFKQTYYVLPSYATLEQGQQVLAEIWDDGSSLTKSYDDGMKGTVTDKTAVLLGKEVEAVRDQYDAFRDEHYSRTKLIYRPLPGEGTDPPPNKRPDVAGWLGVHQLQHHPAGWGDFQLNGPPIVKTVNDIGQLIWAYYATPEQYRKQLILVFRRYHPEEGGPRFRYAADKRAAAIEWIDYVCGDLTLELQVAGVPTDQVVVLGLNEVWEYDLEKNQHTIDFDMQAITALEMWNAAQDTWFSYGLSAMAVGNPWLPSEPGGERQWQRILPLVLRLRDYGGDLACVNYHAYGILIKERPEAMANYAPYLQERWVEYWDWLNANNAAVPVFSGEGGQVVGSAEPITEALASALGNMPKRVADSFYVVRAGDEILRLQKRKALFRPAPVGGLVDAQGMWLNPGKGWNGEIPWSRAEDELIVLWDERWEIINRERNYEATIGVTPFQAGNDGDWGGFNYAGSPLFSLAARQYARWRA